MKYLLHWFVIILIISLIEGDQIITTPDDYYNIIKTDRFQQYTSAGIHPFKNSTLSHDFYYPDICVNTISGNNPGNAIFGTKLFKDAPLFNANLKINKGAKYSMGEFSDVDKNFINILCIEGTLEILGNFATLINVAAIVVLPGGSLISRNPIQFKDLEPSVSKIDPLGFFPGILVLGGTINLIGDGQNVYPAQRVDDYTLYVPDLDQPAYDPTTPGNVLNIYSETFPDGQDFGEYNIEFDPSRRHITTTGGVPIVSINDKNVKISIQEITTLPWFGSLLGVSASIYITNGSNVLFQDCLFRSLGKTTNDPYDDTKIIFDSSDPTKVIQFVQGQNQRDRNSVFIEFSNNVVISGCTFIEHNNTRSPLVFFSSAATLQNNIISTQSGSGLIAQYGTERITLTDNSFYHVKSDASLSSSPSLESMDYGYEGNGIYSSSPFLISNRDTFFDFKTAINFNFIPNKTLITGFNQDCIAPCTSASDIISNEIQYPVDLKVSNINYLYNIDPSEPLAVHYLLKIDNNGNQPSRIFSLSNFKAADAIYVKLQDSALSLNNLVASNNFRIDGNASRLDILNSNINQSSNTGNLIPASSAFSIKDTYIYSVVPNSFDFGNQIYSSINTPYYFNKLTARDQLSVASTYPTEPYQMGINITLNVNITFKGFQANIGNITCEFSSDVTTTAYVPMNVGATCTYPLVSSKEGPINLVVKVRNENATDVLDYFYIVKYPQVTIFNVYKFYSGWTMSKVPTSSNIQVGGDSFINGCDNSNCSIIQTSNLLYLDSLPNVTTSDQLNSIFSSGITTSEINQPVTVNIGIDNTKLKKHQFQLFFTYYQPKDQYTSLLSVYIQNQPVFLLEPLLGVGPAFKNLTFLYDNVNGLNSVEVSFVSRGDIYLTSMAIYSSMEPGLIVPTPPIIPTDTPTNTPSSTPLITKSNDKALTIGLSVGIPVAVLFSILAATFFILRNKRQKPKKPFSTKKLDLEENGSIELEVKTDEPTINTTPVGDSTTNDINLSNSHTRTHSRTNSDNSNSGINSSDDNSNNNSIATDINNTASTTNTSTNNNTVSTDINNIVATTNDNNNNTSTTTITNNNNNSVAIATTIDNNTTSTNNNSIAIDINNTTTTNNNNTSTTNNINNNSKTETFPALSVSNLQLSTFNRNRINNISAAPNKSTLPALFQMLTRAFSTPTTDSMDRYHTEPYILSSLQESRYYPSDSTELPVSFSKTRLDFGLNGTKAEIDKTYFDSFTVTNKTSRNVEVLLMFPKLKGAGACTSDKSYLFIGPKQSSTVNVAAVTNCTTKWLEKFAAQIEDFGHTFLCMHVESVLSTRLDFKEILFHELVGKGSFGSVFRGSWRSQPVAIKLMKMALINIEEANREMDIIGKIRHTNIIGFIGCVINDKEHLCIVTEFAPLGSLGDFIHEKKVVLSMKQKLRFALDIARGTQFLHQCGIIHRDLKPDNVLVINENPNATVCCKITDFGTSKEISDIHNDFTKSVGTPIYMSNQILERKDYDKSTDVYSFAILFYEILAECTPFSEVKNEWEIPNLVISGVRPTKGLDTIDPELVSLIVNCWAPDNRPSFDEIIPSLMKIALKYE